MEAACCHSQPVGNPFAHEYVHHGTVVTTVATLVGAAITAVVVPRAVYVVRKLQSSRSRRAIERRLGQNMQRQREIDINLRRAQTADSSSDESESRAAWLSPRLDPPTDSRHLGDG